MISRCVDITVEVPYPLYEAVARLAADMEARIVESDFGASVLLTLRMLAGTEEPLLERLSEATRGQAEPLVSAPFDAAF